MNNNLNSKEISRLMKVSQYGLWRWIDAFDYGFEPVELEDIRKKDVPIVLHCTRGLMQRNLVADYVPGRYLHRSHEDPEEMLPF